MASCCMPDIPFCDNPSKAEEPVVDVVSPASRACPNPSDNTGQPCTRERTPCLTVLSLKVGPPLLGLLRSKETP